MTDRTTISIVCTPKEREEIARRREIRGFRSDNDYVRHLLAMGTMVEQAMDGKRLNPDTFANAFYSIASKVLDEGVRAILETETAQELREWSRSEAEAKRIIVGQVSSPASRS